MFGSADSLELASLTAFSLLTGNLQGKTCALGRYWPFSADLVLNRTTITALQAVSLLIKEQGKKTKEKGSLISPRKHDFSIDKINRREVHLHQLQSLMKSAANGGLEPTAEVPISRCERSQHENYRRCSVFSVASSGEIGHSLSAQNLQSNKFSKRGQCFRHSKSSQSPLSDILA